MRQKGFTFLEIIIAVAIFSIISVVISTVLYVILNAQQQIQDSTERLSQLQIAMSLIEQDINQIALKNFKGENSRTIGPLNANPDSLSLTTSTYNNPNARFARSNIQRVSYQLENGNLYRVTEPIVLTSQSKIHKRLILEHVEKIEFRYLSQTNRWLPRMGSYMVSFISDSTIRLLPRAIEVKLQIKEWGEITLFCLLGPSEFIG